MNDHAATAATPFRVHRKRMDLDPSLANLEIAIGWDRPLATYFLCVTRDPLPGEDADFDRIDVEWIGTSHGEIMDARHLIERTRVYVIVPEDLAARLESDRQREGARG